MRCTTGAAAGTPAASSPRPAARARTRTRPWPRRTRPRPSSHWGRVRAARTCHLRDPARAWGGKDCSPHQNSPLSKSTRPSGGRSSPPRGTCKSICHQWAPPYRYNSDGVARRETRWALRATRGRRGWCATRAPTRGWPRGPQSRGRTEGTRRWCWAGCPGPPKCGKTKGWEAERRAGEAWRARTQVKAASTSPRPLRCGTPRRRRARAAPHRWGGKRLKKAEKD